MDFIIPGAEHLGLKDLLILLQLAIQPVIQQSLVMVLPQLAIPVILLLLVRVLLLPTQQPVTVQLLVQTE